ncbi:MAG: hypothetical protein V1897_16910 [Pseudomonadota bacterium]|uniref:Uncharacterized protein n=1 Tax=viral metagenome TaxID=1070528 RepID=A0A6M3LLJ5_9ZZZZ
MDNKEFALNMAGTLIPLVFELLRQANFTPAQTAAWVESRRQAFYASDPDAYQDVLPKP